MTPVIAHSSAAAPLDLILGDAEFEFIRLVVSQNAGIVLGASKRQLVQSRLARRIRELELGSFTEYCDLIRDSGPEELVSLINAITTNVTAFFRENHHFEALSGSILPEAMTRNAQSRRLRIWSAGCSSGEEPYSIAMTAAEHLQSNQRWDFKILATDIDSEILAAAARGVYSAERLAGIDESRVRRWFQRGSGSNEGFVKVRGALSSFITFKPLNLMGEWPMRGPFDVIFCRNVMIYFDQAARERLIARFGRLLVSGGYLCLGHSESIHGQDSPFRLVGRTIYRKAEEQTRASESH